MIRSARGAGAATPAAGGARRRRAGPSGAVGTATRWQWERNARAAFDHQPGDSASRLCVEGSDLGVKDRQLFWCHDRPPLLLVGVPVLPYREAMGMPRAA